MTNVMRVSYVLASLVIYVGTKIFTVGIPWVQARGKPSNTKQTKERTRLMIPSALGEACILIGDKESPDTQH